MAADAWVVHDKAKLKMVNNAIDMDSDAFVVRLYASTSNVATNSVTDASGVTNELSTANGYTAGGTATTLSATESSGTTTVDATDVVWTASGGSIVARLAAIVDTTATPDELIAHCLLDNAPADVTATDTNTFTITMNASGIFTVA
jgi:hypothetical protein